MVDGGCDAGTCLVEDARRQFCDRALDGSCHAGIIAIQSSQATASTSGSSNGNERQNTPPLAETKSRLRPA